MSKDEVSIRDIIKILYNHMFKYIRYLSDLNLVSKLFNRYVSEYRINNYYYVVFDYSREAGQRLEWTNNGELVERIQHVKWNYKELDYILLREMKNLTHLRFSFFNDNIDNLPDYIVDLNLGSSFNQKIRKLPQSLKRIVFSDRFNQELAYLDPVTNKYISILPEGLENIYFSGFNKAIGSGREKFIPNNVKEITIFFNRPIGFEDVSYLPDELRRIRFYGKFNQELGIIGKSYLPDKLEYLAIYSEFTTKIVSKFPESLRVIRFGVHFNQCLQDDNGNSFLPVNLKQLFLSDWFTQKLILPSRNIELHCPPSHIEEVYFYF